MLEGERLRFHLAKDRPRLLLAALDLGLQLVFREQFRERLLDLADDAAVALERVGKARRDRAVGLRIDVAEGKLFQFLAHALHAHAAGERRIDVHRLFGDAKSLVLRHVVQRAHVVQPVRQLDQQHADVFRDRQQQLAQVLRLLGLLRDEVELLQLRQAFDQLAEISAEQFVDLLPGRGRVLDRVMQKGNGNRRLVHMHVGQDRGNFERMRKIRIARGSPLMAMFLHCIDICLVEEPLVHIGLVALNALDKLVLTHHGRIPVAKNESCAASTDAAHVINSHEMHRHGSGSSSQNAQ